MNPKDYDKIRVFFQDGSEAVIYCHVEDDPHDAVKRACGFYDWSFSSVVDWELEP